MTDFKPSPEQILEAAMCAWEEINFRTTDKTANKPRVWALMTDLRAALGTSTLRFHTGQIAEDISKAFRIAEKAAGGFYPEAFDWEFVPEFLERSLEVGAGCTGVSLTNDWKQQAVEIGRKHSALQNFRRTKAKLTDREAFLVGLVRCLVTGGRFSDCIDASTMRAVIIDAVNDGGPNELDCEEFRSIAPDAFASKPDNAKGYVLSTREAATILAALRDRQRNLDGMEADISWLEEIATNADEVSSMSIEEINELCERINCGGSSTAEDQR